MKPILSAAQMQKCDNNTIERHGVPSLVLMERAALSCFEVIEEKYPKVRKIVALCGPGNNGGDGVAIGRLLKLKGKEVSIVVLGDKEKFSTQLKDEIDIASSYGLPIFYSYQENLVEEADLVVDALFGIGLSRGLAGQFESAVIHTNENAKAVLAVDIPSGYDADCGKRLGNVGISANETVTFAYMKKGLILGDCKEAAGDITVADVGIYLETPSEDLDLLIDEDLPLPKRRATANKGTCGKVLVIAGSSQIYGACYLSAKAAISAGSGLVKIYTHKNNIRAIQDNLPEAMYIGYEDFDRDELLAQMDWADVILMGPGLGTKKVSENIVKNVLENTKKPTVIDADGINIVALNKNLLKEAAGRTSIILTPHLKEMERLTGKPLSDINYSMEETAIDFVEEYSCTLILKNFTSIVAGLDRPVSYCISGNEGLATAGSGDVLAGLVASLVGQKDVSDSYNAAVLATSIHGKAGRCASEKYGTRGVLAGDIIEEIRGYNL